MAERSTLGAISASLANILLPLEGRLESGELRLLLAELGLDFPQSIDANGALSNAATAAIQNVRALPPIITALADATAADEVPAIVAKSVQLANSVLGTITALDGISTAVRTLPGTGIPAGELNQFADELPTRLFDYLIVRRLEGIAGAAEILDFIGFIERVTVLSSDPQHPTFTRRALHLNQLTAFVNDPLTQLRAKYQWGDTGFTGVPLLQKLEALLNEGGVTASLDTTGPTPVLDLFFGELRPKLDVDPKGLAILIDLPLALDTTFDEDDWHVRFIAKASLGGGVQIVIQPTDGVTVDPPGSAPVEGDLLFEVTRRRPDGSPYSILGDPGGSRLEATEITARAGAGLAWNATAGRAEGTFKIAAEMKGGKLVVSLAGADGFLGTILSGFGLEAQFNVGLGFSSKEGVFFQGSATLDIQLPLHVQLGPVELSALTLTVGIENNTFPIGLRTNIKAMLGPLEAVVEQIGVVVNVSLPDNRKGNAGPVDFGLAFAPPRGVGLSLDVGVIRGGGYLFLDPPRGEYAGALELSLFEVVTINAIGIISTKMPDGSNGFSLLIIMSVAFGTGIQLGFGFTLLAIGGLVGLNRTMRLQALADGIRSGAIESVMFPKDIIANAPKIISDLRAFFPPNQGTFLIGPMAKLGWGTPTLVSLSLGIIIEIPGNIAIVGILRIALPTADAALITLQVNFIGAIEFDKKRIWFFAALFDSRVVFLTIEGEMGLLVAFGDDANFVVSVGGFHPQFSPPPLPFPSPRRIEMSLLSTPVSRLTVQGYFAVTSNTAQFGARVDVFFGLDILNVKGHLAFDALFQFSPFFFIIEISASLSVNVFGAGLFSVGIRGSLKGPAPWNVKGHGSISLLFWDIDVDFEETWGEDRQEELPPIQVLPLLTGELNKPDNWRAFLPAGVTLPVSVRKMTEAEAALMLHPVGVLRVSQRALPLQLTLDKVGSRKPQDVNKLSMAVTSGGLARKDDVFDRFAPAQFQNFSDSDKLSKPAFSNEKAGLDVSASGADQRSSHMDRRVVLYEEIIIDSNYKRFQRRFRGFSGALFEFFLNGAAVARCERSAATKKKLVPFDDKIEMVGDTYAVAMQSNNKAMSAGAVTFHSEASAREFMHAQIAADPEMADQIHVIPRTEMAA